MAVPTRITDFSTTAASNFPAGSEAVGTSLDDYLRAYQAVVGLDLASKGADIASATTTDLGAVGGLSHDITGTTTITSFGTVRAGILKVLQFDGALILTHNATSLILPGAGNITTAAGDVGVFISEGSGNWRCVSFLTIATKALQEAAAATHAIVTPAVQQYHPSAAKAWVNCGVAGDINASYNVTSVTDTGTGLATVTFTTAFSSANYCAVVGLQTGSAVIPRISNATPPTTTACVINSVNTANTNTDPVSYNAAFFGDQ